MRPCAQHTPNYLCCKLQRNFEERCCCVAALPLADCHCQCQWQCQWASRGRQATGTHASATGTASGSESGWHCQWHCQWHCGSVYGDSMAVPLCHCATADTASYSASSGTASSGTASSGTASSGTASSGSGAARGPRGARGVPLSHPGRHWHCWHCQWQRGSTALLPD